MNLNHGSLRNYGSSTFIELFNFKFCNFNETLSNEFVNLSRCFWYSTELVNKVAISDKINDGYVLDLKISILVSIDNGKEGRKRFTYLEHLGHLFMFIDIDVEIFEFAFLSLDGVDEHRFQDIARSTP